MDAPAGDRRFGAAGGLLKAPQLLEQEGVDRIQWDAMDGRSVPNLTFGPDVIAASRRHVRLGFEVQLMVEDPDAMLARGSSWAPRR